MTKKLYDLDAYQREFDAEVVSCEKTEQKDGTVYQVILNQTLFFPEEGGQSPDKGTIDGLKVLDVQIKKDVITHTLEQPLTVGAKVHGIIDWEHRFYNMQQHSGEHIFSGTVHSKFGFNNVGFHLSDNIVTMDFDGVLTAEQVNEIEYRVNEVITENLPVEVTYPSKEELAVLDYRSKIEIEGQVRIVTIPGVDVCACCAPHVKHTGEVGMLKVMSLSNYKGGVRISILCGFRALLAFRQKSEIISAISGSLSANQELLPDLVEKLKNSNQDLKYQLAEVKQKLMAEKIAEIPAEQKHVILFETDIDIPVMRNVINELTASHTGICGIFVGTEEEGYQFIIGSSTSDCREIAALLREKVGARGGGSAAMIQGSVKAKEQELLQLLQG
ncbi:MAG: alanine--tRNA ligase-related protein [Clostridiales bacterium]|nr:alanine--tRNA ligase-related protein [Clostridiales bacterium]